MKSPVNIPTNHHFLHQRSPSCNGSTAENNTFNQPAVSSTSCYEPTSVLDLRRSSSPVAAVPDSFNPVPAFSGVSSEEPSFQWDGHVLPLSSDDWDSMMWALEEKDNSAPLSKSLPQFGPHGPQSPNFSHLTAPDSFFGSSPHSVPAFNHPSAASWNHSPTYFNLSNNFHQIGSNGGEGIEFDCSQLDQLFQAAGCLESNESQSALTILARLNQRLQFPMGKPLQRAAFYFKEALLSLLTGSNRIDCSLSSSEIVYKIRAYKALWEISPVVQFANFTANQALFEAVDGAMFIHIIDFEIGLGGQWASFMQEIASNSSSRASLEFDLKLIS
uniref:Scarecrow-like protein 15 n=1 Tax=Nelumbo nucifera TaxID=4432 RepID=A0A822ZGA7_NELNU|nr:TPA_asm: hypothetical protein HUJ06_014991 [Nelumbo nucifera]